MLLGEPASVLAWHCSQDRREGLLWGRVDEVVATVGEDAALRLMVASKKGEVRSSVAPAYIAGFGVNGVRRVEFVAYEWGAVGDVDGGCLTAVGIYSLELPLSESGTLLGPCKLRPAWHSLVLS